MIRDERIERTKLENGGMILDYLDDNRVLYEVAIQVDAINCVNITVGNSYNDFMSFYLVDNDGHVAADYLEYIQNHMNVDSFPNEKSMEIYKELLHDEELRNCLDKCILNIPDIPAVEAVNQIAKARAEYENTIHEALKMYESKIKSIVNTLRNVEDVKELTSLNNYGLVNRDDFNSSRILK